MSPPPTLRVALRRVGSKDEALLIEVHPDATTAALKKEVAEKCGVPEMCQQLVLGSGLLEDDEALQTHVREGATILSVMLTVTLDEATKRLSHRDGRERWEAVRALAQAAPRSRGAAAAVSALAADPVPEVRGAVLEAVAALAPEGDQQRLSQRLADGLKDGCGQVRVSALRVLASTSSPGDAGAIDSACTCLEDKEPSVVVAASRAIGQIAQQEDQHALKRLASYLAHGRAGVRLYALRAFGAIAAQGDALAAEAVCALCGDKERQVKEEAKKVLARLLPEPGDRAATMVCAQLRSSAAPAKRAALRRLSVDPSAGQEQLVTAVADLCEGDRTLRREGLNALGNVAPPGHERSILVACRCIADQRDEVRAAANAALAKVAPCGDERAVAALCPLLEHRDERTRREAARALARLLPIEQERTVAVAVERLRRAADVDAQVAGLQALAQPAALGDREALRAICEKLPGPDPVVSHEALKLLAASKLSEEQEHAVPAMLARLQDPRAQVRLLALQLAPKLAPRGSCPEAVEAAAARLEDLCDEVRRQAAASLALLAPPDGEAAFAAVGPRLRHQLPEVRRAAQRALGHIAGDDVQLMARARSMVEEKDQRPRWNDLAFGFAEAAAKAGALAMRNEPPQLSFAASLGASRGAKLARSSVRLESLGEPSGGYPELRQANQTFTDLLARSEGIHAC